MEERWHLPEVGEGLYCDVKNQKAYGKLLKWTL